MDDQELARRSITGFAEMLACLGRTGLRGAGEVRAPGAVGARVPWAEDHHWIDAAVVPPGAAPPIDAGAADLPHCLWIAGGAGAPPPRVLADIAMPCMALAIDGRAAVTDAAPVERPPLALVGALNDRAYAQTDRLAPLLAALDDPRLETYGLRRDGDWACVAVTLRIDDDVSIQYVATEQRFRRRGLAGLLLRRLLDDARRQGARTATLQASPDGLPVYARLGFRTVATLCAAVR